jgi:nickel-dependent lactate racemase
MRINIAYGREQLEVEIDARRLVEVERQPQAPPLADPAAAVRAALETPLDYPPLRRALTPDDHVAVVIDEHLPRLGELLAPLLEHVAAAGVAPAAVTLVCPSEGPHSWRDELPAAFSRVRLEVHDPHTRPKLAYLATTKQGRRIYLNRTVVDADQVVVLSGRGYDPVLGYSGAEAALFPALSDEPTRQELASRPSLDVPGDEPWPQQREAAEVAWLLGAPFFLQVIEGAGDEIAHVIGGQSASVAQGQRLLDARWRLTLAQRPRTVLAALSGDPARQGFADLARAAACAARIVAPDGRIVLLTQAQPALDEAAELLRRAEEPAAALDLLLRQHPAGMAAAFQWASAARQAKIYLLSGVAPETAEELFAVPLEDAGQVQRLLGGDGPCLVVDDAHKSLAVLAAEG